MGTGLSKVAGQQLAASIQPAGEPPACYNRCQECAPKFKYAATCSSIAWSLFGFTHLAPLCITCQVMPNFAQDAEDSLRAQDHCRLCLSPLGNSSLEVHLKEDHEGKTLCEYRMAVLGRTLVEWPQPVSSQTLRTRLWAFTNELCDANFQHGNCAVCARQKRCSKLIKVTFPPPKETAVPSWLPWSQAAWETHRATWYDQLDEILNIETYLRKFFMTGQRILQAEKEVHKFETKDGEKQSNFPSLAADSGWHARVKRWEENLRRDLRSDGVPAPGNKDERWMLLSSSSLTSDEINGTVTCMICKKCHRSLSRVEHVKPSTQMPMQARANGMWRGPDPPELACLTYCENKVINLARVYVSIKRIFLNRASYAPTTASEAPLYHQKNVVAYPQEVEQALHMVGLNPNELSKTVLVQFVGADRAALRREPDLSVSVQKLRAAFRWLSENSWPFMEATKNNIVWESGLLDPAIEDLLTKYEESIGSDSGGVPSELIQGASRISEAHALVTAAGPSDCREDDENTPLETEDNEATKQNISYDIGANCAAAVDGGIDEISPLKMWDTIMKKYKIAQRCEEELARLKNQKSDLSKQETLERDRILAIGEATEILGQLTHKEARAKLDAFVAIDRENNKSARISTGNKFLSSSDPLFWYSCFLRLFPRGDCLERCMQRDTAAFLPSWRWAKTLLTRADNVLWRSDVEFVASLYNIFLRRDQIQAVEVTLSSLDEVDKEQINSVTAEGILQYALHCGDVNDIKSLLKRKSLDGPLRKTFMKMQVAQSNVRGSEGERDSIIPKFFGMRLWCGCSSLFFTLNPHDIRSPITLSLLQADKKFDRKFSLELTDAETMDYMKEFLHEQPRRLHQLVASNPLVAARTFHWTVRLVVKTLFNCEDKPGVSLDSVVGKSTPGIFGCVRGFFGVVEPQMRKALHIHMLVQLLGFTHPDDILGEFALPDIFRRLWYFVASISFKSTEGFAEYLNEKEALTALQTLPLLPLTKKQRGMIGEQRSYEAERAQLCARGLQQTPIVDTATVSPFSFKASAVHADPNVNSSSWSRSMATDIAKGTPIMGGNHVCRDDVCHKGRIGRRGFCRMMFWHWARHVEEKKGFVAKMAHGLELVKRYDGQGSPPLHKYLPLRGLPALEISHPFHFKMTPAMMLGPKCNHDLGVLLRFPVDCFDKVIACTADPNDLSALAAASSSMLEAIGDHEYYCASYSGKEQPHVEGLLATLSDALRSKERDLAVAKQAGENVDTLRTTRSILHRLKSGMNRRMHKGFPEMLTYLLRKPMEYASHKFVSISVGPYLRYIFYLYKHEIDGANCDKNHKLSIPAKGVKLIHMKSLSHIDYCFRPAPLEEFPLYFFFAACKASEARGQSTMEWVELGTSRQRSYMSEAVSSKSFPGLCLMDPEKKPLHRYAYYVHLRTNEAWYVPVFYGKLPRVATNASTMEERKAYALTMMSIFCPYRYFVKDILNDKIGLRPGMSDAVACNMLWQGFVAWKADLASVSSKYFARHTPTHPGRPAPNTKEWWACVIHERLRNYEAIRVLLFNYSLNRDIFCFCRGFFLIVLMCFYWSLLRVDPQL